MPNNNGDDRDDTADRDELAPGEIAITGNGDLLHRDDLDYEVVEQLEDVFSGLFPGFKVRFAGDIPNGEVPPAVLDALNAIKSSHADSLINGKCLDCGRTMPGFDIDEDEFELPDGWRVFNGGNGEPCAFQCPQCDEQDDQEPFRLREI